MENKDTDTPVEEVEQVEGPKKVTDRHEATNPYRDEEEFDKDKHKRKVVLLPAGKYSTLMSLLDFINNVDDVKFKEIYTKKQAGVSGMNIESLGTTIEGDVYAAQGVDAEDYVNDIKYADNELNPKHLKVGGTGTMTGSAAIAKFSSAMGIGESTHVPLWHSGIWVTIKPPKDTDVINLEIALANNQIKLGRDTNTLVYSNYSVVFNRIITDFIITHTE